MPPSRGGDPESTLLAPTNALGADLRRLRLTVFATSLSSFCLGYNSAIVGGAVLYVQKDPAFEPLAGSEAAFWKGMLVSCLLAGAAVGAACGSLSDVTGRRRALLIVAWVFVAGPTAMALAPNIWFLIAARSFTGLAVGVCSVLVNLYISEIAPADIRGELGGWAPFLGTFGIMVSYIVSTVVGLLPNGGWRLQFGLALVPALCQLLLSAYLPETPRWLLAKSREPEALASMRRLFPQAPEDAVQAEIMNIKKALSASEAKSQVGLCGLCSNHLLATYLGVSINVLQQVSGINVVIYFGPTILNKAGFNTTDSLICTGLVSFTQLCATAVLIRHVDRIGRRPLALVGLLFMKVGLAMLVLSFFCEGETSGATSWTAWMAVGGMFVFRGAFSLSLGPLPYIMTSEFFPQEARATGTAVSWMSNWASNFCVSLSFPIVADAFARIVGKSEGIGLIFCIYIIFCILAFVLVQMMLPETRGLQLEAAAGGKRQAEATGSAPTPSVRSSSSAGLSLQGDALAQASALPDEAEIGDI